MDRLNKEDILGAWRALSDQSQKAGWRTIVLATKGTCTLRIGRCFPKNEESLLVRFGIGDIGVIRDLPAATGFKVEKVHLSENEEWFALVRQTGGNLELFTTVVIDLASSLLESFHQDDCQMLNLFMQRLRAWISFMKKGSYMLSPEAELGLIGELQCMSNLLAAGCSAESVVESWVGPMDSLQDFQLGHGAIEVKSTLAKDRFTASIISLGQLDDSVRKPIVLCACRFSLDPTGTSLPDRIKLLKKQMDDATSIVFSFSLLHAGYLDAHAESYKRQFLDLNMRYILVDDNFPRLTVGNIPSGVISAKYEIDLDSVELKQHKVDDILKMIGIN